MKSMSGRKKTDPILADIQRAFASGYMERRKKRPCKVATASVEELYAELSGLSPKERRRLLASWSTPMPGKTGRVSLS